jgi:lipoprotein signal peptidase
MFNLNIVSKLPRVKFYQWFGGLFALGMGVNYLVRLVPIDMIKNKNPFGLLIDIKVIIAIYCFMVVSMLAFGILRRNPMSSAFILIGGGLNIIERLVNGYVLDYIRITWGYINLYDVALWFGLLMLNYEIWFNLDENPDLEKNIKMNNVPTEVLSKNNLNILSEVVTQVEPLVRAENKDELIRTKFKQQKKTIETVAAQIKSNMKKEEMEVKIPKIQIPIQKQLKPKIKIT